MTDPQLTCTRDIYFEAGHRVYGHESKCAHLHGHSYKLSVTARKKSGLDNLGRVIDFSVLKSTIEEWVQEHWDHGMILFREDPLAKAFRPSSEVESPLFGHKHFLLTYNPTAENLAKYILLVVGPCLL